MLRTCQNKRKKLNFICRTCRFAYNNQRARARARISSRTTINNETQHPWTKEGFGSFVSIHYSGNERRWRRIATSLARNDFINHKHREIPNRKWKAFCHSLYGILRQVLNIRWHSCHTPAPLNIPFTMHQIASAFVQSSRALHLASIVRYRKQTALPSPAAFATTLSGQFSDLFLCITWLSPMPTSHATTRFQRDGR